MKDIIGSFFSKIDEASAEGSASQHKILIATCALLIEMARIDGEFTDHERENILAILEEEYGLSAEDADEISRLAEEELSDTIHLWKFTNLINENYDKQEKLKVVEFIWEIVYADGKLDKHEDYLVHKLSRMLNIPHRQMIDAKLSARKNNS